MLLLLILSITLSVSNGLTPLMIAADQGDLKSFTSILKTSPETIDSQDINKRTTLHHLARWSSLDVGASARLNMVNQLIALGAKLDVIDSKGKTALHLSAEMSYKDGIGYQVTKSLIEAGANKDIQDEQGYTPVMHATVKGFEKVSVLLIEAGANIDAVDLISKYTVFLHASRQGRIDVVKALLKRKIDVHQRCEYGNTGIHLSEFAGHMEVADIIREYGGVDYTKVTETDPELEKQWEEKGYPKGVDEKAAAGQFGGGSRPQGSPGT